MVLRIQDAVLQRLKSLQLKYLQPELEALKEEVSLRGIDWVRELPKLKSAPKSILIFKPDDIGDAVQSLPAIKELSESFPQSKLFLICQEKTKSIFEASQLVDEIASLDVSFKFVRFPILNLAESLKKFSVKQFDVAVFLRTYSSYFEYFKKLPARNFIHPKDPRMKTYSPYQVTLSMHGEKVSHQSLLMLELVSLLTRKSYVAENIEYPKLDFGNKSIGSNQNQIIIHPFAKYETKRFSEEKWKAILTVLVGKYPALNWAVIGGKEDLRLNLPEKIEQLQGKLSLKETGSLMQKAVAFIGNESGPGHLAAAMGIPTLTLMGGHSDPDEWSPYGNSLVLRNSTTCSPCHRRVCPGLGLACFEKMTVETTLPIIEEFLQKALSRTLPDMQGMKIVDLSC